MGASAKVGGVAAKTFLAGLEVEAGFEDLSELFSAIIEKSPSQNTGGAAPIVGVGYGGGGYATMGAIKERGRIPADSDLSTSEVVLMIVHWLFGERN